MRLLILSLIIFVVAGCSKKQLAVNKLNGEWTIVSYQQTHANGLVFDVASEGTFAFNRYPCRKVNNGSFGYFQSCTDNNQTTTVNCTGNYSLTKNAKDINVNIIYSDGSIEPRDYSINILTTTDLKMSVTFNDLIHTYVLKKKK